MTDLALVKTRQQAAWSAGDYANVGNRILVVSELLCDAVDLRSGERVLDVATGTGNAALAAARRFAKVTAVDYVPELLERGKVRADAEGLDVDYREGDAEDLPFDDNSFDVVVSACGAMFAPDHQRTADELVRVCRPGGRIGMVNWCPDGYIGALFAAIGAHVAPPAGVEPPVRWGDKEYLQKLWGDRVDLVAPRRTFLWRFPSVEQHVEFMAQHYGPTMKALDAAGTDKRAALLDDLASVARRFDRSTNGTAVIALDYLEVVATKR